MGKIVHFQGDNSLGDSAVSINDKSSGDNHAKKTRHESLKEFRRTLPIYAERSNIIQSVRENRVLIVVGETGSGKTTQIPQYLFESGFSSPASSKASPQNKPLMIACTQPRRVAAISLARRVSEEMGSQLGQKVGYSIRFEDCTSDQTRIKYLTDGMMLRELLHDQLLSRYSVIILDEAHERTLRTDILFGMVKEILNRRKDDLRVIIMSATLNVERFSAFFDGAPVLRFSGRQFPVRVFCSVEPLGDYLDATVVTIFQTHTEQPADGDILAFLTGQEEIESVEKLLLEYAVHCPPHCPKLVVCPLFANLPSAQQSSIFSKTPAGCRKVVLATNIAETSITIPGIKYVIDCGLHKVRGYDSKTGMETLSIQPISKASAKQRTGRAGRESAGTCYRLYTEETFNKLAEEDIPEIQRCHLANVILLLKASNISNIADFKFIDKPSKDSMQKSLEELLFLKAFDSNQSLTQVGREMAEFPIDPPFSRTLIASKENGCVCDVVEIIALLSVESVFYTPNDKREEAAEVRRKFVSYDGDLITLGNVLKAFLESGKDKRWCVEHFINHRAISQVLDVQKQLYDICERMGYLKSKNTDQTHAIPLTERILQSFLKGSLHKLAARQTDGSYKTLLGNQIVHIHPSSVLFGSKADLVMYCEIVCTSKQYMRSVSRINNLWLQKAME